MLNSLDLKPIAIDRGAQFGWYQMFDRGLEGGSRLAVPVHEHNTGMHDFARDYAFSQDAKPEDILPLAKQATFQGIRRANGKVGTRNYIGVLTSVNCSATVARIIAREVERSGLLDDFSNVDGVIPLVHGHGCGMDSKGEGYEVLKRTQWGYAANPNMGAVLMVGLGCETFQIARWKQAKLPELGQRLKWAVAASVLATLLTGWLAGRIALGTSVGLWMTFWIVSTIALDVWDKVGPQGRHPLRFWPAMWRLPRAMQGMLLAHLGVAVFAFGVSMVRSYETEKDVKMSAGDTVSVGGYAFTFQGAREVQGPNYVAARGEMVITRDGNPVTTLNPEKRIYRVQNNPMTEAAIDAGLTRDLYVSMGEQLDDGAWVIRVYHKPFVDWIWGGCLVMALGGMLALSDRRYRARQTREQGSPAGAAA